MTEAYGTNVTNAMNGSTLVEVTAPANLNEGYQLQVNVGGSVQTVTVPPGGVKEGQTFQVQSTVAASSGVPHDIPSGKWRDGLCDCCTFGCCHAMCCFGCWFTPVVAGQVMTRMSRDWCGGPGQRPSVSNTCAIVTAIFITVAVIDIILRGIAGAQQCLGGQERYNDLAGEIQIECPDGTWEEPTDAYQILNAVNGIIGLIFAIYFIVAVCRTRNAIRKKYDIPPSCCGGCDDCCCTFWCGCCTVEQMARHTNDYKTYDVGCCSADCCNKRGQQERVPEIV